MQLIKSHYHNCFSINLCSILARFNKNNNLFWHQAGLYYEKGNDGLPIITTSYKDFRKLLGEFGVNAKVYKFKEVTEIIDSIKEFISNKHVISLELDCYELPYCLSYQGEHDLHWLEIVDYKNGKFYAFDHYFGYMGEIEEKVLEKSLESLKKSYNLEYNQFFISIDLGGMCEFNENWHDQNIHLNQKVMFENYLGDCVNESEEYTLGINAINSLEKDTIILIDKLRQSRTNKLDKKFEAYFLAFKEIANSRYNYSVYLEEIKRENLSEINEVLFQNWRAVANILMKGFYSGNFEKTEDRIIKRLDKIKNLEYQLKINS
ncbi:BtrH N-terminal domain-containing protein [Bacillus pseudomycoides]|uniref:Uncharacterized protein n=1 Tax=Bacillus pseudomycoides TaxID=64104 RepID=A0A2C3VRY9_9BACI|nr:BtrH N-terminal domain-containing protein [Bacillus pseudomycoides]PEA82322.1 hypothetical protein CON99_17625 [Bacillus pseudomycoides]PED73202.1 hypothetical protein CON97_04695 [Bacillus pseudomycoides]PEI43653.1 hypothetical protein CN620_07145 [Bacillus pseudomycoides]PEJ80746.1 hypothetical protein CN680_06345 [Bacillus pseudomycoides]PEM15998.1 hypothetical protein CN628_15140 [Bacillus pseudomycoides]